MLIASPRWIFTTEAADAALKGARAAEKSGLLPSESALRILVSNWKTRPIFAASGSEGTLQLKGAASGFDATTFKPTARLSITGGQVKVVFTKGECGMVAVYSRLRGTAEWTKLGTDSQSPYYDTRPLAVPGQPEVREYLIIGILDDEEIGQPSDIAAILTDQPL